MKQRFQVLAAVLLAAAAFNTSAATQGNVGSTSQGTVDITLNVAKQIIVKNLDNVALDTSSATAGSPIEDAESFCVGGIGFPNFSVDLSSTESTTAGEYYLDNGTDRLRYYVSFANNTSASTLGDGSQPSAGTNGIPGTFNSFDKLGCTNDNSTIVVSVPAGQWESARSSGNFTDTLTVLVTAN